MIDYEEGTFRLTDEDIGLSFTTLTLDLIGTPGRRGTGIVNFTLLVCDGQVGGKNWWGIRNFARDLRKGSVIKVI